MPLMAVSNVPFGLSWARKYLIYAVIAGAGVASILLFILFDFPLL
jgi:hypothetical protein